MLGKRFYLGSVLLVLLIATAIMVTIGAFAQWQRVGAQPQEDTRSIVFVPVDTDTLIVLAGMKRYGVFYSVCNPEFMIWSPWQKTGLDEFALYDPSSDDPAQVNTLARQGTRVFAGTSSGKILWSQDDTVFYTNPWIESSGLPGDPIMDIKVANNGDILAAVRGSGIYKSTDMGETFSLLAGTQGAGSGNFMSIALHFNYSTNGKFWAVTQEGLVLSGGIYFWNGSEWTDLTPIGQYSLSSIVISPEAGDPSHIWAGDLKGSGLLESQDLGQTWSSYSNLCDPVLILNIPPNFDPFNPQLFIGTTIGLFHLVNYSVQDIYPTGLSINTIKPDPVTPGLYWFSTSSGVRKGFPGEEFPQSVNSDNLALFDIGLIESSPGFNTDNTIFALSKKFGLFISRDGGNNFNLYMPPLERSQSTNPGFEIVGFGTSPVYSGTTGSCNTEQSTVYIATKGRGVFKSASAGSQWLPLNDGISDNLSICAFAVTPNPFAYPLFASRCGLASVCRFNGSTSSWECQTLINPIPNQVNVIAFPKNFPNPPIVYVGTDVGLFISNNGGTTFVFDETFPVPPSEHTEVTAIAFDPQFNGTSNQTVFVVRGGSIFKKVFNIDHWEWQLTAQASFPGGQYYVKNITVSSNYQSDGRVAATFNNPLDHTFDGVWLSSNGGFDFTNITNNLPDRYPLTLKFIQTQSGIKLFAGLRKERLWFTNEPDFNNWLPALGWETSPTCVNATAMSTVETPTNCSIFSTPTDVFLGTCKGVFWSNDGGETFRPINEGLTYSNLSASTGCIPIPVTALHLENAYLNFNYTEAGTLQPILIAGTDGFGIWYRTPTLVNVGGTTGWDWSNGVWMPATGIPSNAVIYNFTREKGLSNNSIKAATNSGVYASQNNLNNPAGKEWYSAGLNEDVRGICFGQSYKFSSSSPHIPEAPSSGVTWGTTWGTGVKKGTEVQNLGSPTPETITWETRNGQGAGTLEELNNWSIVQLSSDGTVLVGGDNKGIFRTPDEGLTLWYPSNGGIENTSKRVRDLVEVESNGDILCAIEGSGSSYDGGIFISADNGFNWACLSAGFDPEEQKLSDIVYSSGNPPVYYAGTYDKGTYAGTVSPLDPPTITSIDVTSGSSTGGTTVTITGTSFRCSCPQYYDCEHFGISQAVASFGGIDAETTSCSSTQLVVTTPSHLAGTVNVTVRNPDTRSATATNAFTYTGSSSATLYISRNGSNNIVVTTDPATPTRVFRATNPQFTGYVKVDTISSGSFTYTDNSGENAYIYYYKVE